MNGIKILLGDPRHSTVGEHSNFVPIGIGYIATNLLKQFENNNLELKIATRTDEIFSLLQQLHKTFNENKLRLTKRYLFNNLHCLNIMI